MSAPIAVTAFTGADRALATRFTKIDHAVKPKAGMALLWNNLTADGLRNDATMHCGEIVTRGHKIIITKWFRIHGDGPVFDES